MLIFIYVLWPHWINLLIYVIALCLKNITCMIESKSWNHWVNCYLCWHLLILWLTWKTRHSFEFPCRRHTSIKIMTRVVKEALLFSFSAIVRWMHCIIYGMLSVIDTCMNCLNDVRFNSSLILNRNFINILK